MPLHPSSLLHFFFFFFLGTNILPILIPSNFQSAIACSLFPKSFDLIKLAFPFSNLSNSLLKHHYFSFSFPTQFLFHYIPITYENWITLPTFASQFAFDMWVLCQNVWALLFVQRLFSVSTSEKPLYCLFSQKLWYIPEKDNLCIHAVGLMVCFSFMYATTAIRFGMVRKQMWEVEQDLRSAWGEKGWWERRTWKI